MTKTTSRGAGEDPVGGAAWDGPRPTTLLAARQLLRGALGRAPDFWRAQAAALRWERPFSEVQASDGSAAWFCGGRLNAALNVLGAPGDGDERLALRHLGDDGEQSSELTRGELRVQVQRAAAALLASGCGPGERVALYLPDGPEAVALMLAAAWIGATYVPIPWRFTAALAAACVRDCGARRVLVGQRSDSAPGYAVQLEELAAALPRELLWDIGGSDGTGEGSSWSAALAAAGSELPGPAAVDSEHPLLLLYSKSSAGVPRGSVFASGGFVVQTLAAQRLLFGADTQGTLCTHDLASAVGQSHGLWGTLLNGGTLVLSGRPGSPSVAQLGVALARQPGLTLLTNPAFLGAVRGELERQPLTHRFPVVACSGEVLTPRIIAATAGSLCREQHDVLNLWLFAESGTALVATLPHPELQRPGALGLALPGVEVAVRNDLGQPCQPNESGQLLVRERWPAMARGAWGQPERHHDLFFRRFPGWFHTSDGARRDADGFFWFMGRLDDRVKVHGQSIATSEIEAVLAAHPGVSEAAVLGVRRESDSELWAFVVARPDPESEGDEGAGLSEELRDTVEQKLGAFAVPGRFVFVAELPRTRTGKVVRRLLRRVAAGDVGGGDDLGHVRNPECLEDLIRRG